MNLKVPEIEDDIMLACLAIVSGHRRRLAWYREMSKNILHSGGECYVTYMEKGHECRAYMPHAQIAGRNTENKGLLMEQLSSGLEYRRIVAVELALRRACGGMDSTLGLRLRDALLSNCESGRVWPFQKLNIDFISKADFYRRKNAFLYDVAKNLELL